MSIRKPKILEAFSTVFLLIGLIIFSVIEDISSVPMLIIASGWCILIGQRCGHNWKTLMESMLERLSGLVEVILIIFSIGIFISSMIYSGTIPALIYYLVNVINPNFMIVLSFLITGTVAMIIGTSWGTAGTVGIVMVSIASSMGVSMPMVAGAVISGAHVGQILSPMSDTSNVAANLAKTDTLSMIKRMSYYAVPVVIISTILYTILGFIGGTDNVDFQSSLAIRNEIASTFNTNPVVILPMLLVFYLTFKKKPIIATLITSAFIALLFGKIFNGYSLARGLQAMYSGFKLQDITGLNTQNYSNIFLNLVNRGGMLSMVGSVILAIVATCYGALMTKIKAVDVIAEAMFSKVNSRTGLVFSTIIVSGLVVALTTSSYLAVLISSDLFKEKFYKFGMNDQDLIASCMPASSQFVTCVPWVDTAIYLSQITGVPTMLSLPFNFFCWGNAVMAIVLSIFGIGFKEEKMEFIKNKI